MIDVEKWLKPENIQSTRLLLLGSFEHYFKFMFTAINLKKPMFEPFHKEISFKLENIAKGKNKKRNLFIAQPVGSGKSLLVEYYISWCFARNINNAFVYTSYNNELILKLSKETREICQSETWQELFRFELKLDDKSKSKWSFEGSINRTGLSACPIGGSITGLDAGNPNMESLFSGALIIDDPADAVDCMRYARTRQETILFYNDKLATRRRTPTTPTILIAQRLHKEDLIGWILENEPEEWDSIVIPAMQNGKSFWEKRYPLEELEKIKRVNPYKFNAQYQQNPISAGGSVIKSEWFKFYQQIPEKIDKIFITADTAQKVKEHNDFTVFAVWCVFDSKLYLIDMLRGKFEAPELLRNAEALYLKYKIYKNKHCTGFYIEDKASGTGLIQQLKRKGVNVVAVPRATDKLTRVEDGLSFIEAGEVLLPIDKNYSFNKEVLAETESFTRDDSHSHDDIVDNIMDAINIGLAKKTIGILDVI